MCDTVLSTVDAESCTAVVGPLSYGVAMPSGLLVSVHHAFLPATHANKFGSRCCNFLITDWSPKNYRYFKIITQYTEVNIMNKCLSKYESAE